MNDIYDLVYFDYSILLRLKMCFKLPIFFNIGIYQFNVINEESPYHDIIWTVFSGLLLKNFMLLYIIFYSI